MLFNDYKYGHKGHDLTTIRLQREDENNNGAKHPPVNEIRHYTSARYLTGNEAIWRLFEFPMSDQSPCIIR